MRLQCVPNASPMRLQCVSNASPMRPQCVPNMSTKVNARAPRRNATLRAATLKSGLLKIKKVMFVFAIYSHITELGRICNCKQSRVSPDYLYLFSQHIRERPIQLGVGWRRKWLRPARHHASLPPKKAAHSRATYWTQLPNGITWASWHLRRQKSQDTASRYSNMHEPHHRENFCMRVIKANFKIQKRIWVKIWPYPNFPRYSSNKQLVYFAYVNTWFVYFCDPSIWRK